LRRAIQVFVVGIILAFPTSIFAASGRQPAPPGSFPDAPPQYTHFTTAELVRGFMALSFGSDLLIGKKPKGIHRYDHPIHARVISTGSVDRMRAMQAILDEYARSVPNLRLSVSDDATPADVEVRLIDEKNFQAALEAAFGRKIARTFVARTDPQCMTSVKSNVEGEVVHSMSLVIVDKGNDVFLDCAYHEMLHAFGLPNHDQRNPFTTLNQTRKVGYLSVYDRALLTLLYDPRVRPGMTRAQARAVLPGVIEDLGLTARRPGK
jgi:hypothetical protein